MIREHAGSSGNGVLALVLGIAGIIGAFVLLTTPVAGHVIARASYFAGVPLWSGTLLDERRDAEGTLPHTPRRS